jgi:hypothetical protein
LDRQKNVLIERQTDRNKERIWTADRWPDIDRKIRKRGQTDRVTELFRYVVMWSDNHPVA